MAPEAVSGAEGEVARVLACATHYQVLEVASNADEAALKRAKKLKQLSTHPDKLGPQAVGAGLAFQRVVEVGSWDLQRLMLSGKCELHMERPPVERLQGILQSRGCQWGLMQFAELQSSLVCDA